jgi:outer membrane protein TolC
MKTIRENVALLCAALMLSSSASVAQTVDPKMPTANGPTLAQQNRPQQGAGALPLEPVFKNDFDRKSYWFTKNYRERGFQPIYMGNSSRLESLLRAGKIYLSLQDAIALALENNLDIELQRYGPQLAEYDLLRAEAGGVIRGVQTQVTQGPSSAVNLVTGGFGAVSGGTGGGNIGGIGAGGNTGTVFQVTGSAIPNLDPVFTTSFSQAKNSNPQTNSFVTGLTTLVLENTSYNMGLSKQFLSGTGVDFRYQSNNVDSNSPNNDLNPFTRSNAQLQITQRLLQGFGIAVNNRNIRVAKNNLKVSDLVFKQQVITTVGAIINLYWDLVSFNEDLKVKQKALETAQKLYEDNQKQVEIGTLAPIEIVRAEAEVARTQQDLTISETQLLQQEAIIKNALSRTGIASASVADARIIPTDQIRVPSVENINLQELTEAALANRPELAQTAINIQNTKIGLAGAKSQLLPSLDVFASATNNGLAGQINDAPINRPRFVDPFFVGNYGTAFAQILRRNFPDYNVGFQLNVPLRNRAAQADIANDTLRLRQQELQEQRQLNNIRLEVTNAVIALQQARARHQAAVKSRQLQEQTLEAEQKKYALGSSTIFLVIQAQRDLAQAQAAEVTALANYSRAKNGLDQSTGMVLEVNQVSLEEALRGSVARGPSPIPDQP